MRTLRLVAVGVVALPALVACASATAAGGDPCLLDDEQVASAPTEFLPEGMSRSPVEITEREELTAELAGDEDLRVCRYTGTVGQDMPLMIDVVSYGDHEVGQAQFRAVMDLPNATEFDHDGTTIRYGADEAVAEVDGTWYGVFWWQETSAAHMGSGSARILQQIHENG